MENEKRKIMIFGGTGYIGSFLTKASLLLGHPTFVYARPITSRTTPSKVELHKELLSMGATFVLGELEEHEKIVSALREVDVVISALAYPQVLDQLKIIDAIKVASNIKRFLPSEFGSEEDRITPLSPFDAFLEKKRKIRRVVEAAGIPYTFVSTNCCGSYFVNYLLHPHAKGDDIDVYGSGEAKAVLNYEEDIAAYTIKVATDHRTCNCIVIYRPPKNILSQLELISLWERKTGRSFNRIHVSEEEIVKLSESRNLPLKEFLIKKVRALPPPNDIPVSILHSVFIKGQTVFELREDDMEASRLYPDYEYTTIDQLLDIFLVNPPKPAAAAFG